MLHWIKAFLAMKDPAWWTIMSMFLFYWIGKRNKATTKETPEN